jgi:hypothetical protein
MQCRYCFGTDDDPMIAPCLCRGTSQFTHEACLQRYFVYYPDRVCRVCNAHMEYVSLSERMLPCLFVPILTSLVMLTNTTPTVKLMLLLGGLGLSAIFALHPVFQKELAIGSFVVGGLLLIARSDFQLTVWLLGGLSVLLWMRTILHYIPATMVLFFLVCGFLVLYLAFFMMAMVQHLDALGTAIFAVQIFLYWQSILHLRPALGRNPIRNE